MKTSHICKTISVEEAGCQLGLSRPSAYAAARRGDIPVIRVGRRVLVPIEAFEALFSPVKSQIGGVA